MKPTRSPRFSLLPVALAACLLAGGAIAQTRAPTTAAPVQVRIAAQPLAQALNELALQTHLELIAPPALVAGKSAPAVSGLLTPQQALARLLEGSGLAATVDGAAVIIKKDASDGAVRTLNTIEVTAAQERANGPVYGYVAKRSATGTKTDTALEQIPQSISVVTRDQMADQDVQSVAQALRYSSGVFTEYRGASNLHDEMFVRGFYYVPRYLNGLLYGNGSLGQIDPYLLERVELLRGPASALYGQSNPGGVVNMVSKQPAEGAPQEVEVGIGSRNRLALGLDLSGKLSEDGELLYRLVASGEQVDTQEDGLHQKRYALAPSVTWRPSAATDVTVQVIVQREPEAGFRNFMEKAGIITPTPYGYIPRNFLVSDPNYDKSTRDQDSIGYSLRHAIDDKTTFHQNLRVNSINTDYRTLIWNSLQSDGETITRGASGGIENMQQVLVDNQLQYDFDLGQTTHKLLLGLDAQQAQRQYRWGMNWSSTPSINWRNPVYNVTNVVLNPTSDSDTTATQTGLYVQDQIDYGRLSVAVGLRQDWARTSINDKLAKTQTEYNDNQMSGRLGAVYAFDNGVSPYASYSTSFEPVIEAAPTGQAPFKPTTAQQFEVGVRYTPKGSRYSLTASVYDLRQQNVLFYDYATSSYRQTGGIKNQGLELEAKVEVTRNFSMTAAYSNIDSRVTESVQTNVIGKMPARIPSEQASVWGKYDFSTGMFEGFGLGLGVRYISSSQGDAQNSFTVPSVTLLDAGLTYDVSRLDKRFKGVKAQLNVTNLTDENFVASCASAYACFLGNGRTVTASVKHTW